jgi:hypothetical protein
MAIYHLSAAVVKRSAGHSTTAAAAYRAGVKIADERMGKSFDYTRRSGVRHTEIMAPANAPAWMSDRAQLWNAVEKVEKRKDAQLAREIKLALPHELDAAQRLDLVRGFVKTEFVDKGMIADVAIHAPSQRGDQRNAHAHIMLTMRELTGEGFGKKARDWNDSECLEGWRASWAERVNRALEDGGHDARVDHRSLKAQGIDREAQIHKGPNVVAMEGRGVETERGERFAEIEGRNEERAELLAEAERLAAQRRALEQELEQANDNSLKTESRASREDTSMDATHSTEETETPAPEIDAKAPPMAHGAPRQAEGPAQHAEPSPAPAPQPEPEEQQQKAETDAPRPTLEAEASAQPKRESALLAQMERQAVARRAFLEEQTAAAEQARRDEEARRKAEAAREGNGDVADAKSRYAQALADEYRVQDPYASLARASMNEYGRFTKQQEDLSRQIAAAKTPDERRNLELRKEIEGCEYMATTSTRLAGLSRVVTGDLNSEQARRDDEKAKFYQERATALRAEQARLGVERGEQKGEGGRGQSDDGTGRPAVRGGNETTRFQGRTDGTTRDDDRSRAQKDEGRQRASEDEQRKPQQDRPDKSLNDAEAGQPRRAETSAERMKRYRELSAQTNARGAGRDNGGRGGPANGNGGGGRGGGSTR